MRLIDADALIKTLGIADNCKDCPYQSYNFCGRGNDFVVACEAITDAPIIDTVKHGRWVKRTDENCWWYECSECGDYPMKNVYGREELSAYCAHCGARMEGEEVTE